MKIWWAKTDFKNSFRAVEVLEQNHQLFLLDNYYDPGTGSVRSVDGVHDSVVRSWQDENIPKSNFISMHLPALCVAQKDFDLLTANLNIRCSFFTSRIDDGVYCTLVPRVHLNCLSMENSVYKTMKSGNVGRFMSVAITKPGGASTDLFSLRGPATIALYPFVSDRFKEFCNKHRLTGLDFKAVTLLS